MRAAIDILFDYSFQSVLIHVGLVVTICVLSFRSPMFWELMEPCPPPKPGDFTEDPRYQRALQTIGLISFLKSY